MLLVVILMTIGSGDRSDGVVVDDNLEDTYAIISGGDRGDDSGDGDDKRPKMTKTPRCTGGRTRATWGRTPT